MQALHRLAAVRIEVREDGRLATVLVASDARTSEAGRVSVLWTGSRHAHVARRLPGVPEVAALSVDPERRGEGVATALLSAVEVLVLGRGRERVGLAVGTGNPAARSLYERRGYRDAGLMRFSSPFGPWRDNGRTRHVVEYLVKDLVELDRPALAVAGCR